MAVAGLAAAALAAWLLSDRPAAQAPRKPWAFDLPLLHEPERRFSAQSMAGKVWVLNIWASWCAPCVAEHPVISELAKRAPVVGVDYMDRREEAIAWLRRHGDPFHAALFDPDGALGAKAVPATLVVDKRGAVRYERTGPITRELAAEHIVPLIAALERE